MEWLKYNRTGVWALILCDENEVTLAVAQEPEIAGMYDWISSNGKEACDHSFHTEEEAAMNAVLVLGLDEESGGSLPDKLVRDRERMIRSALADTKGGTDY